MQEQGTRLLPVLKISSGVCVADGFAIRIHVNRGSLTISDGVGDERRAMRISRAARVYERLIRRAQQQITLSMAYFIPIGGPLRALLAATIATLMAGCVAGIFSGGEGVLLIRPS